MLTAGTTDEDKGGPGAGKPPRRERPRSACPPLERRRKMKFVIEGTEEDVVMVRLGLEKGQTNDAVMLVANDVVVLWLYADGRIAMNNGSEEAFKKMGFQIENEHVRIV